MLCPARPSRLTPCAGRGRRPCRAAGVVDSAGARVSAALPRDQHLRRVDIEADGGGAVQRPAAHSSPVAQRRVAMCCMRRATSRRRVSLAKQRGRCCSCRAFAVPSSDVVATCTSMTRGRARWHTDDTHRVGETKTSPRPTGHRVRSAHSVPVGRGLFCVPRATAQDRPREVVAES